MTLRQLGDRFGELIDRAESIGLGRRQDRRRSAQEGRRAGPGQAEGPGQAGRGSAREDRRRAEDEKIDPVTATALRKLLDGYERPRRRRRGLTVSAAWRRPPADAPAGADHRFTGR
ncbi:hypothetical protein V2I01_40565 [Micromonospora sp. BRA006-A]|nr:hypothetical protein [Micromonospora sp. BRA006-A]